VAAIPITAFHAESDRPEPVSTNSSQPILNNHQTSSTQNAVSSYKSRYAFALTAIFLVVICGFGIRYHYTHLNGTLISSTLSQPVLPPNPLQQGSSENGTDISSINGKYVFDVIKMTSIKNKLEVLLDNATLKDFTNRLQVSGPVELQGEWLVGSGIAPHSGGSDEAAFAINSKSGALIGVMMIDGKQFRTFGVGDIAKLPPPLFAWYQERRGPASAVQYSDAPVGKTDSSQTELQRNEVYGTSIEYQESAATRKISISSEVMASLIL
jgi:hypothetical protein